MDKKPFGEHVEGLSYCGDKSCVIEPAVQKDNFHDPAFRGVVGGKPLLPKGLRKFKNFHRQLAHFVVGAVHHVELQLEARDPVPQFRLLGGEHVGVDFIADAEINESVLLVDGKGDLPLKLCPLGERIGLGVFRL